MNNERRKRIKEIVVELTAKQEMIDSICDEEQDYFDNIPENLQSSNNASNAEEAIESLENASESLSEAIDYLTEIY